MNIPIRLIAVTAAALALTSTYALAGERGARHGGDPGIRYMHHVLEQLDLTPEQEQTVEQIFASARPRLSALHEEMRDIRHSLIDINPDDPDYATVVNQASQKSGELASELVREMSQVRTEIHAVLTDEQKAKLPEIRAQMKARFEERRDQIRSRKQAHRAMQDETE
ncbi:MAG TPA: Spy/CpxP family protein refolding chaperone [Steroidobacteraceae bacterium]|nr:Spy/CpxP family protein refolding chaperone [Steroidobacteraceae bacterium]